MTEEERQRVCSLFDTFTSGWSNKNLKKVMSLGFARLEDMEKLHGCYIVSKEDSSVFVDPITTAEPVMEVTTSTKRQWMLDDNYEGFLFVPRYLLVPFKKDKEEHPQQMGPLAKGDASIIWPKGRDRKIAG